MLGWLRDAIETAFRFFPFPTETGLRIIGSPGTDAPVFVTCNFDMSVRHVTRMLQGLDCFLLVAPSKGINVWCAAGGGFLSAHSISSVVKTSGIEEKVSHRKLILPQLAATGIDVERVRRQTGWRCQFGPVYARDIRAFVACGCRKDGEMRKVSFPLGDRLQMAVMWAAPMSILVSIPVAFLNPAILPGVLALIWGFTLFVFGFFEQVMRHVPGPVGVVKTLVLGIIGVGAVAVYGATAGGWEWASIAGWGLGIMVVALVLGFDLEGSSPTRAGSTVAYWARVWPGALGVWAKLGFTLEPWFELEVDPQRCTGCQTCVSVCPKDVYRAYDSEEGLRSEVVNPLDCVQCSACVKQCPEDAIVANPPIRGFA